MGEYVRRISHGFGWKRTTYIGAAEDKELKQQLDIAEHATGYDICSYTSQSPLEWLRDTGQELCDTRHVDMLIDCHCIVCVCVRVIREYHCRVYCVGDIQRFERKMEVKSTTN